MKTFQRLVQRGMGVEGMVGVEGLEEAQSRVHGGGGRLGVLLWLSPGFDALLLQPELLQGEAPEGSVAHRGW